MTQPDLHLARLPIADVFHDSRIVQQDNRRDLVDLFRCGNLFHDNALVEDSKLPHPGRWDDPGPKLKPAAAGQIPPRWLNWTATSATGKAAQ